MPVLQIFAGSDSFESTESKILNIIFNAAEYLDKDKTNKLKNIYHKFNFEVKNDL